MNIQRLNRLPLPAECYNDMRRRAREDAKAREATKRHLAEQEEARRAALSPVERGLEDLHRDLDRDRLEGRI